MPPVKPTKVTLFTMFYQNRPPLTLLAGSATACNNLILASMRELQTVCTDLEIDCMLSMTKTATGG